MNSAWPHGDAGGLFFFCFRWTLEALTNKGFRIAARPVLPAGGAELLGHTNSCSDCLWNAETLESLDLGGLERLEKCAYLELLSGFQFCRFAAAWVILCELGISLQMCLGERLLPGR